MVHRKAQAEHDRRSRLQRRAPLPAIAKEAGVQAGSQPGLGWTVVLRRQPARIVDGQPEGGYTDVYELICCECGDNPDLDYRDVSPELQRVRGPYPFAAGIAAYEKHVVRHQGQHAAHPGESSAARGSS